MAKLAVTVGLGTTSAVGVLAASAATYQKLSETSFEQQILASEWEITGLTSNSSDTSKLIVSASFVLSGDQQRTWICEVRGEFKNSNNSGISDDWSNAKTALETEMKSKLKEAGIKQGFVKSCANNRIKTTISEMKSVVIVDYTKQDSSWKFVETSLNELLNGKLQKRKQETQATA